MMEVRRIVSNTGPLISLEKLRQGYDFIRQLYQYLCQLRKAEGGASGMNTPQAGDLIKNLGQ